MATVPETFRFRTKRRNKAKRNEFAVGFGPTHSEVVTAEVFLGSERISFHAFAELLINMCAQDGFAQSTRAAVNEHHELLLAEVQLFELISVENFLDSQQFGALAAAIAIVMPAWAHHSHANYQTLEWTNLAGTVKEVHWLNPHVWVYLQTADDKGPAKLWTLEGGSPAALTRGRPDRESLRMPSRPGRVVGEPLDRPRLSLLGAVELTTPDGSVALGGPVQRAILARLALDRGRSVAAEVLIDGIWGSAAGDRTRRSLATLTSRLRRAIEPVRWTVASGSGAYRLDAPSGATDLEVFEEGMAAARRAGAQPARAAGLAEDAAEIRPFDEVHEEIARSIGHRAACVDFDDVGVR